MTEYTKRQEISHLGYSVTWFLGFSIFLIGDLGNYIDNFFRKKKNKKKTGIKNFCSKIFLRKQEPGIPIENGHNIEKWETGIFWETSSFWILNTFKRAFEKSNIVLKNLSEFEWSFEKF